MIQKGNEGVVHHFIIMVCDPSFPEHVSNYTGDCDDRENMPEVILNCRSRGILVGAWAVGGGVSGLLFATRTLGGRGGGGKSYKFSSY